MMKILIVLVLSLCLVCPAVSTQRDLEDDVTRDLMVDEFSEEIKDFPDDDEVVKDPIFFGIFTRRRRKNCARRRTKAANCRKDQNGCGSGVTTKAPLPYRDVFTLACNKHDNCYSCSQTRGWSQSSCDKRFKSDMDAACNCKYANNEFHRSLCLKSSKTLYFTVAAFGGLFRSKNKKDWCRNDCVVNYGSPNLPE